MTSATDSARVQPRDQESPTGVRPGPPADSFGNHTFTAPEGMRRAPTSAKCVRGRSELTDVPAVVRVAATALEVVRVLPSALRRKRWRRK